MPRRRKRKGHYHRGVYTSIKTGNVCKFRSGWEEKVMMHLDSQPAVQSWTYELTVIPYISNARTKKMRNYYPDFFVNYVDGRREMIEVKPKRKLSQRTVQKKIAAATEWCAHHDTTFRVLTEIELKALGLL